MEVKKVLIRLLCVVAAVLIIFAIFFKITVAYSGPTGIQLNLPESNTVKIDAADNTITMILLGGDKVFYYDSNNLANGKKVSASVFGAILANRQKEKSNKKLSVVIKPSTTATYKDVTNALHEMENARIQMYSTVKMSDKEASLIKNL